MDHGNDVSVSAVQPWQVTGNIASSSMEVVRRYLTPVNPGVVAEYLTQMEKDPRLTIRERGAVRAARRELEAQAAQTR